MKSFLVSTVYRFCTVYKNHNDIVVLVLLCWIVNREKRGKVKRRGERGQEGTWTQVV